MRTAIIGAGGIACSYAAVLASRGHRPVIWSPSNRRGRDLQAGAALTATGALEGAFPVAVADSPEALLADAPAVIVAVPAYGYKSVLDRVVPHLRPGQLVIVSAHLSFAALYVSKLLAARGLSCPVAVWNTTASTGRLAAPAAVSISLLRARVEMAVIPHTAGPAALALCEALFGPRFALMEDMIGVDLGNLNPLSHYGLVLGNITRIEKAETWAQMDHLTPALCRLLEDLDRERLALAAGFGVRTRSIHESHALPGKIEPGPLEEMMPQVVRHRRAVNGPTSLDTRYVTEDVPYGLVATLKLAGVAGVPMPLHAAGVLLFSSLYRRDLAAGNLILPEIAAAFADRDSLRRATRDGWGALTG